MEDAQFDQLIHAARQHLAATRDRLDKAILCMRQGDADLSSTQQSAAREAQDVLDDANEIIDIRSRDNSLLFDKEDGRTFQRNYQGKLQKAHKSIDEFILS